MIPGTQRVHSAAQTSSALWQGGHLSEYHTRAFIMTEESKAVDRLNTLSEDPKLQFSSVYITGDLTTRCKPVIIQEVSKEEDEAWGTTEVHRVSLRRPNLLVL
ncbi:hypothetical protein NDU88_001080 [Pleurodeles waltl]|uniref:Uncharacterized protein n=1 Tax=Pleurodeles waltl TaxID=8319 RepID=A0AAV7M750_PLEWA|nr:hypothetical protein NDU88_001080 [Pleurodeles waltl]